MPTPATSTFSRRRGLHGSTLGRWPLLITGPRTGKQPTSPPHVALPHHRCTFCPQSWLCTPIPPSTTSQPYVREAEREKEEGVVGANIWAPYRQMKCLSGFPKSNKLLIGTLRDMNKPRAYRSLIYR